MTENQPEQTHFRDKLGTIGEKGKRVWIYPKKPQGRFYNRRRLLALALLAVFFILPFIKYQGDPVFLFNILERKFILFGVIFWPQDFHLVVLSLITFIVFIILFTVIFGRLFCGWVCPQTIFMEFVFRQIEYWIDGDAPAQRKLAAQAWNTEKIVKRTAKHLVFYGIAFLISNTFLSYIIGWDQLKIMITDGPVAHAGSFIALLLFSGVFYFVFAWFREQVCIIACPYGRLQGVLLDRKSVVVAYDYKRGEKRSAYKKGENRAESGKGDCIDCNSCVLVCPTGIDIRNGTQLECINCTACIDACDKVMERVNLPRGLIRYDSEKGIAEGIRSIFNPRSIAYSAVLTILLVVVSSLFAFRTDFEATILRSSGTLYQEYGQDSYSNIYSIQVVNKTRKELPVEISLLSHEGSIQMMGDPITAKKGEVAEANFLVVIDKDLITSSNTPIELGLFSEGKLIENYQTTFVGPNKLDQ